MSPTNSCTTSRLRRVVLALVLVALVAAGCGDDSSSEVSNGQDDDGSSTDSDSSDDDLAGGLEDSDDSGGEDSGAQQSGNVGIYCAMTIENDRAADSFDPTAGPEATEYFVRTSQMALDEALAIVPQEIRSDLETVAIGFEQLAAVLESNGWDFFDSLEAVEAISDAPDQQAASDRIDDWESANCDLPADPPDDPDSALDDDDPFSSPEAIEAILATEAGRELMIDGMTEDGEFTREEAGCLIDELAPTLLAAFALGDDPEADLLGEFFAVLDTCSIPLDRLSD